MISATIALILLGTQAPGASSETTLATYKLAGRDITARIPNTSSSLPKARSIAWNGYQYLFNEKGKLLGRVAANGGWSDIQSLYDKAKAKMTDATRTWKVKAVVFTRFDALEATPEGVVHQRRPILETTPVTRSLEAFARFAAVADALGGGKFKISLDVEVEDEMMHFGPERGKTIFDEGFTEWYFGPRINGGEFEAEDKVYRGPYDSVFYIHPATVADGETTAIVNRTPVTGIAYGLKDDGTPSQDLACAILNAWVQHLARAATRYGCRLEPFARFGLSNTNDFCSLDADLLSSDMWSTASNRLDASSADYVSQLERSQTPTALGWADVANDPLRKLPRLELDRVLGTDGKLQLKPDLVQTIPNGAKTWLLAQADVASFVGSNLKTDLAGKAVGWVQSSQSSEQPGTVFFVFELSNPVVDRSDLDLLDTKETPTAVGTDGVTELSRLEKWAWNRHFDAPVYDLPATIEPQSAEAKALLASKLNESSSASERSEVISMLSQREELVRLNAAMAFTRVKEPTAEAPLIALLPGYTTRIGEMALKALAFQGTETAWESIRNTVNYGRWDYTRQIAATLLGSRNDPKLAGSISTLATARSWQAMEAAAEAIGKFDDKNAAITLMWFLQPKDPAVRLTATKLARPEIELVANRMLWSAVNDPSDQVRAWSYIQLIKNSIASNRDEGYKGVRDDSVAVRLIVLDYLRTHPVEANRSALRIAVADSVAEVRAAALAAFTTMPGEVSLDEIRNTVSEKDPRIQTELVGLALAKKIKLPQDAVTILRSSLDPHVRERAKELAE